MKKRLLFALLSSAAIVSTPTLALDYSSSDTVKQVQEALNNAGYDCGVPDGIAGNATASAIAEYRKAKSLKDGSAIDQELCVSLGLETESETKLDFIDKSDGSLLKGMTITAKQMKSIYNDFEAAWASPDYPLDNQKAQEYEEQVTKCIAEKYGFTEKQVENVYSYVISYGVPNASASFKVKYGTLLDANLTGTTLIIKAKIEPLLTNKQTIDQNYFNVCDIIKNQGGDAFDRISYWAVADMTDGSEGKVISFDVPKDVIDVVATGRFPDNQLGDYVEELWILPSLK